MCPSMSLPFFMITSSPTPYLVNNIQDVSYAGCDTPDINKGTRMTMVLSIVLNQTHSSFTAFLLEENIKGVGLVDEGCNTLAARTHD